MARTANTTKFANYGSADRAAVAVSLKGNLDHPIRFRDKDAEMDTIMIASMKKKDATEAIKKLIPPKTKVTYSTVILARKRNGVPVPIAPMETAHVAMAKVPIVNKKQEPIKAEQVSKEKFDEQLKSFIDAMNA